MSLINVRFEIKRHYDTVLKHVSVSEHGGAFGLEDIKRYAKRTPHVVISCLAIPEIKYESSVSVARVVFGAFCLTEERSDTKRDVAALALVEATTVELTSNDWNSTASGSPKNVSAANLFSGTLDKYGIAMWAIRWEQRVDLDRNVIATLDDFLTMTSEYDIAQTDDTINTTDKTVLPT